MITRTISGNGLMVIGGNNSFIQMSCKIQVGKIKQGN